MIKMQFRKNHSTYPVQEICPWLDFISDSLILNKDGSLLAGFDYVGVNPLDIYDEKIDAITLQLQRALSSFDNKITAWWIIDKRQILEYEKGKFDNETSAIIDKQYAQSLIDGKMYRFTYSLYLLYTMNTGVERFFDRYTRARNENNVSMIRAFFESVLEGFSSQRACVKDISALREMVENFERILISFVQSAPLTLKRKKNQQLAQDLATLLNRAEGITLREKPQNCMLDSWSGSEYISEHGDSIQFCSASRDIYAASLGIVRWPEQTTPMLFETLLSCECDLTLCEIVRFLDNEQSVNQIDQAIAYYNLTKYALLSHAIAKLSGSQPEPKTDKLELIDQCIQAKTKAGVEGVNYAYMSLNVFVYASSQASLDASILQCAKSLTLAHFGVIRERINTLPSFLAMLPGQWAMQSRYELVSIENVSDMAPIYTTDEGKNKHAYFSQIYNKPVPAMTVFKNRYGGRYYFNAHVQQVGHAVIIAPTGGGKTTFVNFCLSQFQRYKNVNTIIFDRNYSCKILTQLHEGTHIDLKNSANFNPFFALRDGSVDGIWWLRDFILRRLAQGGYQANAQDRIIIDEQLSVLRQSDSNLCMSALASLLPSHLEKELSEWLSEQAFGMFDSITDDFSLSKWTTIEMSELMRVERLACAFMDYAFRKIDCSLDGTPTFIYLEEASFLLNNPIFREAIDDWLKTFRKKNAFVWMSMQSPESITSKETAATILDNVMSFILLPNERIHSHRIAYREYFGLQDHQIDLIASLRPQQDYLLIQNGKATVIQARFNAQVLAFLRSEAQALRLFEQYKASQQTDWQEAYIRQMSLQMHQ